MVNTHKICSSCGPVETRYSNCPRCWGPVQTRRPQQHQAPTIQIVVQGEPLMNDQLFAPVRMVPQSAKQ